MKRDFAKGAAWNAAASWIEQGVAAVIFLLIARLIGVEDFGIVSMSFAFLFLGEFLVRDTISEGIVAQVELEDGRLEATFVVLLGFSLAIVLVLAVVAQVAARLYGEPDVALLLTAASPTVLMLGLAGVPSALLRRALAFRVISIRIIVGVVFGGIVGIGLAWKGFGAWSLVGQRLAEIGMNSIFTFIAAGWLPKRWPSRADLALLKGLGPQVVSLRAITLVIMQTPTVLLGILAEPRAVGLFAFALRLVDIVLTIAVRPVQGVAQSALAAVRRQRSSTARFFLDLAELAAFTGFTAFAGLALIADPLIDVMLGPDWHEVSLILPLLCLAGAASTLTAIQESYLLAVDRLPAFIRAAAVEAVIGLVLVALASRYGAVAAAGAVALRAWIALPLRTRAALGHETIGAPEFVRSLTAPILLTAGMAAVVALWRFAIFDRIPDLVYVVLTILVGVLAVLAQLFTLMPGALSRLKSFLHHPVE